jgi:hypothetical protein
MLSDLLTAAPRIADGVVVAAWTDNTSAVAATVGVAFGVPALWSAAAQLRLARQAALTQAFATLATYVQSWDEPGMVTTRTKVDALNEAELRDAVETAFSSMNTDEIVTLLRVPNYFEFLALATNQGAIPLATVATSLAGTIIAAWQKWSSSVAWIRESFGDPGVYLEFELLAARLMT